MTKTRRTAAQMSTAENVMAVARLLERAEPHLAAISNRLHDLPAPVKELLDKIRAIEDDMVAIRKRQDEARDQFASALKLGGRYWYENPATIGSAVRRLLGL